MLNILVLLSLFQQKQNLGEICNRTAGIEFPVHPHMLRHATGYKLANDGQDTRAIQHYLGHRNIQHTARFRNFWQD
jgi:site-specific recombinase XerD